MLIQLNKPPLTSPTTELTNLNLIPFCGISTQQNADATESISNLNRNAPKLRIMSHYLAQYMQRMSFNGILLNIQKYYTGPDGEIMGGATVQILPLLSTLILKLATAWCSLVQHNDSSFAQIQGKISPSLYTVCKLAMMPTLAETKGSKRQW